MIECDFCWGEITGSPVIEYVWPQGVYCSNECIIDLIELLDHLEYMEYNEGI